MTDTYLLVTEKNKRQAEGNKAIGYFMMPPIQFLALTTSLGPSAWMAKEDKNTYPVEQYNAWQRDGSSLHMPWLDVSVNAGSATGKIVGHEGRHRAAALINAGHKTDDCMPVAIRLFEQGKWPIYYVETFDDPEQPWQRKKRYLDKDDIPTLFIAQFDGHRYVPKFTHWHSFYAAENRTLARIVARLD